MVSPRETYEYFLIAKLMSIYKGEGRDAYQQCCGFLSKEMFSNKQLRWVYGIICEMYEAGRESTCEDDIATYIYENGKAPVEKIGSICCFLIEVYIQFCDMTRPITNVPWTVTEAVDAILMAYDGESEINIINLQNGR